VAGGLEKLHPEAIEQLAYHYSRSGVRVKTLFYLDKAASKAQHEYANETALNYYNQALALEERWEWRRGQVEVLHTQGRREEELVGLRALDGNAAAPVFEGRYLWGQYYEAIGEYMEARAQVERALAASHGRADIVQEMRCLAQLGLIARRQGDYEAAKVWYRQALALFQDQAPASDRDLQAFVEVLNGLGTVHRQQGDFDATKDYYQRALMASRQGGNRSGESTALHNLGVTAFYQRNFAEALIYHQQALEIRRSIGHRTGEGISYHALAQAIRDAGDYIQAQEYFSAALSIHQATGNRWEEVNVWNDLGILCQELGDLAQAQSCLQHGLELSQAIGDLAGQAYILANLGPLTRDQGNLEVAENLLADGLTLAQAQTDIYMVSYFLSHMAVVSLLTGRLDQALERASAALTMRRQNDLRLWTTADLATIASTYLASGKLAQALDYAQQALSILNECGGEGPEAPHRDYFICYQVLSAAGQIEAARAALEPAYALVMARARKLTDPAIRRSFLERVRINHAIVQEERRLSESV
jgi:tetratricopeptide (TPR) repeat protein